VSLPEYAVDNLRQKADEPGYRTIKKLLSGGRFDK
jgi:hypothetical protein